VRFRPGAPFRASGSEGIADPTDRESVSLGGASPLSPTISLPGRLISRTPPFEGGHVGANPAPAANLGRSSFDRSVVKQDHVWPTPRNRRGSTFPSDQLSLCRASARRAICLPCHSAERDGGPRGVIRSASVSETRHLAVRQHLACRP
jgi:hypothetical protein